MPIVKIGRGDVPLIAALLPQGGDGNDAAGVAVGQWAQQHGVHDSEYGGVGGDTEGHDEHGQ